MRTVDDLVTPEPHAPRRPPGRARAATAVALLVAVAVGLAVVAAGRDDGGGPATSSTAPAASTTTVLPATTTVPATSPSTAPAGDRSAAIWPAEGSGTRFADPQDAARDFASTFLRFEAPVAGAFRAGDARSGEVDVRPARTGPATTVLVRQVGGDDWSVIAAVTDGIRLDSPAVGTELASPVMVTGRALAFEGHVDVEVREDGRREPVGHGFVTGGGDELRPFAGDVAFAATRSGYGTLVLYTSSAENGQVWEATAVRVRLRAGDVDAAACGAYRSPRYRTGTDQVEVKAYFNCDADGAGGVSLHPVYRAVPRTPAVLQASLLVLLQGPTAAERAASLGSWFSASTAGRLRGVTVRDGHAVVDLEDLRPVIPGASSSAGSARLLSQLDATVFQFRTVRTVEYRLQGSCEAFTEWLQLGGCEPRTRAEVAAD